MDGGIGKYSSGKAGYSTLFRSSGTWKIAVSNAPEREEVHSISRHFQTDESFILLEGGGYLITAEVSEDGISFHAERLERNTVYNIPPSVWHAHMWDAGTKVLIVEESDTGSSNSEERELTEEEECEILSMIKIVE